MTVALSTPNAKIGPSFPGELRAAGLMGLPFAWGDDGTFTFDPQMTPEQIAGVQAVFAAHDPTKPNPNIPTALAKALDTAITAFPGIDPRVKAVFVEWRKLVQ